jgi:hypothetical protein
MEPTNIAIESSSTDDDLCRLNRASSTASDWGLEEGLGRALENSCSIEYPARKKRKKKESWTFRETAKVVMPPPSTIESSTSKVTSCLEGSTGDNRQATIANMLQEATDMARAVGELDPEPEEPCHSNGRRRFQRRKSFVIQAPAPSATNIEPTQGNT